MKKLIVLLFVFQYVCTITLLQAQHDKQFYQYVIINDELSQAINEVIDSSLTCPYFSILQNPFLVKVVFYDGQFISITLMPYSVTRIMKSIEWLTQSRIGIGKHNDIFFLVLNLTEDSSDTAFKYFLSKSNNKSCLPNVVSYNLQDHHPVLYNHITIYYNIHGQQLEQDPNDMELCRDDCCFSYLVKKNDTWKSIARKSHCPQFLLKKAYPFMKKPIEGYMIDFRYLFKDNALEQLAPSL